MHGAPPSSATDAQLEKALPLLTPQTPHALDTLFSGLAHEHWRYRQMALAALPRFVTSPSLLPRLIEGLSADDNIGLRNACIHALVQQGDRAAHDLVAALHAPDRGYHKFVAEALGQIGGSTAREGLLRALDESDTMTYAAVVEALGNIGGDGVTQELTRRLSGTDNDSQRTLFILDGLGRSGAHLPVATLLPFAKERVLARAAYRLLGTCGQLAATSALVEGICGSSSGTRAIALHALATLWRGYPKRDIEDALLAVPLGNKREADPPQSYAATGIRERLAAKINELLGEADRELVRDAIFLAQFVAGPALAPRIVEAGMQRGLAEAARQTVLALGPAADAPLRAVLDRVDGQTQTLIHDVLAALRSGPPTAKNLTSAPSRASLEGGVAGHVFGAAHAAGAATHPSGSPIYAANHGMGRDQFARLADIVSGHCGIILPQNMQVFIEHRLQARLEALNLDSFAAYLALLRHEGPGARELDELVELIVTKESFFFRERPQLRALIEEIIPGLLRAHPQRLVRIWCAGCSTGEEPYTLAMLLDKAGLYPKGNFEIFASDISRKALRQAKAGVYRKFSLRDTTGEDAARYFTEDGALYTLNEEVRKHVSFGWVNLIDETTSSFLTNVDVVLCRNVMIYFSNVHRKMLLRHLHKRMRPGGTLLLGHSESLINVSSDFDVFPIKGDIVYRKPEGT